MKSARMPWVDSSKGVGILLVIFGHVLMGVELAGVPINELFYTKCMLFVYSFHMPLFFILTGLFFEKIVKKSSLSAFIVDKIKILIYPFVIWSVIQTMVEVLLSRYTNNHASVFKLFYVLIVPSGHFWFLIALFLYNIINAFLFRFVKDKWFLISFVISILLFELPIHLSEIQFQKIVDHFIYLNIGILISRYLNTDTFAKISKPIIIILTFFCFLGVQYLYLFTSYRNIVWAVFLPQMLGVLVVVQLCMLLNTYNFDIFKNLGHYSFPIYLLHMLLIAGTRIVLQKIFNINNFYIHLIVAMVVGAYMPVVFYRITLKTNYIKWLFIYPNNKPKYKSIKIFII